MPFTPTHIAAILPIAALRRRELPFSALAIGAMLPDLPLFLPRLSRNAIALHGTSLFSSFLRSAYEILFQVNYYQMHSIPGLFTICLPLGMACFLCFQNILKEPLYRLLPQWFQQRMADWRTSCVEPTLPFLVGVSLSIVIGSGTHVLWDSFTHEGQWGTRLLPILSRVWIDWHGYQAQGCRVLQHVSTVIFLPIMCVMFLLWLRNRPAIAHVPASFSWLAKLLAATYVFSVFITTGVFVFYRSSLVEPERFQSISGWGWNLNRWVTQSGSVVLVTAAMFGCLLQLFRRAKVDRESLVK